MTQRLIDSLALFVILLLPAFASAQSPVPHPIPTTTMIAWDHDGQNVERFELIINGEMQNLGALTPHSGNEYRVPFPALVPGLYIFVVQACAQTACAASAELQVSVFTLGTPENLRILQVPIDPDLFVLRDERNR